MKATSAARISQTIDQHRPGGYEGGRRELRTSLLGMFASALIKPPRMTGSAWAEKFGRIPKSTGSESGPVTLYGYQRELLDAMCDPTVPEMSVMKAARVGYTRCFTLAIAYHLHHDPTLCAVAQPVKEDAEDFGGTEIAPMLRETPVLKRMIRPARRGEKPDKNIFFKLSNGASCRIVGAAADDAFRRYSARFLAADEIDGEGWSPGFKSQGDKLKLFWTRGETFWNRKLVVGSTPLDEETSRIAARWKRSDQRRYFVPCPQCEEMQFLDWGDRDSLHGIKWDLDEKGKLANVWYVGTCGCVIDEAHKPWMDARGEWRPTNPDGDHRGYQLWTGMSLQPNASWPSLVKEWLEAQSDPASLVKPFVNLRLGRTYKATYGQEIKATAFILRREAFAHEVPPGVILLTAGIDVQSGEGHDPRIEVGIYGWGRGLERWLIGHFVLRGDPAGREVWQALDALLRREFVDEHGRRLIVQAAAIDSGGHHTAEAYTFCNERRHRRIWAIKGKSEIGGRRSPVWPRKPSSRPNQVWYMIGGNAARDWAYGSLAISAPGPRFVHFPENPALGSRPIDDEFFAQLTAEKLKTYKGRYTEWVKAGVREVGVCFVYAYAAVCGLQAQNARFLDLGRVPDPAAEPTEAAPAQNAGSPAAEPVPAEPELSPEPGAPRRAKPGQTQSSFIPRDRTGGWMNRWRN